MSKNIESYPLLRAIVKPEAEANKRADAKEFGAQMRGENVVGRVAVIKLEKVVTTKHPDHAPPHEVQLVGQRLCHALVLISQRFLGCFVQIVIAEYDALGCGDAVGVIAHPEENSVLVLGGMLGPL